MKPYEEIMEIHLKGLHSARSVSLDVSSGYSIIVNKNGSGKTTFLNVLSGLFSRNGNLVFRYDFSEILFLFADGSKLTLSREEIKEILGKGDLEPFYHAFSKLPGGSREMLWDYVGNGLPLDDVPVARRLARRYFSGDINLLYRALNHLGDSRASPFYKYDFAESGYEGKDVRDTVLGKWRMLRRKFPFTVLYLPTYRLVELQSGKSSVMPDIGGGDRDVSEFYERYSLRKVKRMWVKTTDDIRRQSARSLAMINGRMLDELTREISREKIDYESFKDSKVVEIVLARSGTYISKDGKAKIHDLVKTGDIRRSKYLFLAYTLSHLIGAYAKQQVVDAKIKRFVSTVNEYLEDKELQYDETQLEIKMVSTRDGGGINLGHLSSGEKQLVLIFTELYFSPAHSREYAVFIDEPELSLSIEWQRKIVVDVVESGKCGFLIAATHSPFIFENSLDRYAKTLKVDFGT